MLDVLRFEPILKRARWGGRRLGSYLHKSLGLESDYAESWELVDHGQDQSRILSGPHAGITLGELTRRFPRELFGNRSEYPSTFPLLVKFLDAQDLLSVQVHPNDIQAPQFIPGSRGKTEAWYILDAAPESCVYAGFQPGTNADKVRQALRSGTIADLLIALKVQRGDTLLIPAGTVHALGKGVLLLEIQQASDITFRLDDWGRAGADGKPRALHIEESLQCLDFESRPRLQMAVRSSGELIRSDYFALHKHVIRGATSLPGEDRCRILSVIAGQGRLITQSSSEPLAIGKTFLIPACVGDVLIESDADLELIETRVPDSQH
ncbi:MAG: type I phosphomannose isomerase catalytic subunit [Planctomycetales bacterium]